MAKLASGWWIFVGILVIVISYYVEELAFSFYLGIAFIAFGLIKFFIFRKIAPAKEEKKIEEVMPTFKPEVQRERPSHEFCPRCRAKIMLGSRFCSNCGSRLRE